MLQVYWQSSRWLTWTVLPHVWTKTTFLFPWPASREILYIEELWLKLVRMIGSSRNLFALFWMELVY